MACGALEKPLRGKASKPRLAFQVSAGVAGSGVLTAEASEARTCKAIQSFTWQTLEPSESSLRTFSI